MLWRLSRGCRGERVVACSKVMTSAPQSRYPYPKSLPSGEGLAIALTGSNVHIDINKNKEQRPRNNKSEAVIKESIFQKNLRWIFEDRFSCEEGVYRAYTTDEQGNIDRKATQITSCRKHRRHRTTRLRNLRSYHLKKTSRSCRMKRNILRRNILEW